MRTWGVVAEFNPLHNGHAYLMEQARLHGATHIVVVMSGNFVQRGEPAVLSKWCRTEMALRAGADLVLELPLPWAVSSAETFARGAVGALTALGCVDRLIFGCECGDLAALQLASQALDQQNVLAQLHENLARGDSYPAARQKAVQRVVGGLAASVLEKPNDILAVEYCKALQAQETRIIPYAIPRIGTPHDALQAGKGAYASASFLRGHLSNPTQIAPYLPKPSADLIAQALKSGEAPCMYAQMERAVLAQLRRMNANDFADLPDVTEGLEHRLFHAVQASLSLEEVWGNAKAKRYTHARLRRITLAAFLGIQKWDVSQPIPYLRVLGLRETGRAVLREARKTATLPIKMRARDFSGERESALFALECRASDLWALGTSRIYPCHLEQTSQIVLLKEDGTLKHQEKEI